MKNWTLIVNGVVNKTPKVLALQYGEKSALMGKQVKLDLDNQTVIVKG